MYNGVMFSFMYQKFTVIMCCVESERTDEQTFTASASRESWVCGCCGGISIIHLHRVCPRTLQLQFCTSSGCRVSSEVQRVETSPVRASDCRGMTLLFVLFAPLIVCVCHSCFVVAFPLSVINLPC